MGCAGSEGLGFVTNGGGVSQGVDTSLRLRVMGSKHLAITTSHTPYRPPHRQLQPKHVYASEGRQNSGATPAHAAW